MINKTTAIQRATKALMQARRDGETAVSRQQRDDAHKRVQYWQEILRKVEHLKEDIVLKSYSEFIIELKKTK